MRPLQYDEIDQLSKYKFKSNLSAGDMGNFSKTRVKRLVRMCMYITYLPSSLPFSMTSSLYSLNSTSILTFHPSTHLPSFTPTLFPFVQPPSLPSSLQVVTLFFIPVTLTGARTHRPVPLTTLVPLLFCVGQSLREDGCPAGQQDANTVKPLHRVK